MKINNVLIVEPHPDDGIIGCGGTIAKLIRENPKINISDIYFCPCFEDPRNKGNLEEHIKSLNILGVNEILYAGEMPRNEYLETHKQECRDILYRIRESYCPEIVFCPTPHDFHQDHNVVTQCCKLIFKDTSCIFGYEVIRSVTPSFKPNMFAILNKSDVSKKIRALEEWKSQLNYRFYFNKNNFIANMRYRGIQAKTEYSEGFEILWLRV
jgi:LmbE family N-acetylglucosaminyl deacetylase